jgi:hypothetical protein
MIIDDPDWKTIRNVLPNNNILYQHIFLYEQLTLYDFSFIILHLLPFMQFQFNLLCYEKH